MPKKSARDSIWELLRGDWGNLVPVGNRVVDGCLETQASVPHTALRQRQLMVSVWTVWQSSLGHMGWQHWRQLQIPDPWGLLPASCLHWGTGLSGALPAYTPLLIETLFKILLYIAYNVLDISDILEQSVSLWFHSPSCFLSPESSLSQRSLYHPPHPSA